MNNILTEKLNEHLTKFIDYKWEETMESVDLTQLSLERLTILKTIFHLGYQQGYEDNFEELKEIYENDFMMLADIFDESSQ